MADPQSSEPPESRGQILRDLLVFQVKLWIEGFKDLALMPLSLGAACIDILFQRSSKRGTLYSVMKLGDRFERWVNLYAALDEPQAEDSRASSVRPSLDDLVTEAEDRLRESHSSSPDAQRARSEQQRP